ncbi:hypothetical protein J3454_14455 [Erythrobacter sp. NFXS35]|uniref:hypothetical protein n=1 Tax=Erythrobacter sp. NFXS35 TaxID=2818436 RepID=UPI0032DFCD3A
MITIRQAIDQIAHFAAALVILLVFAEGGIIGGAVAGLGCGLIREVAESGNPVRWPAVKAQLTQTDAPLDILFWSLGGFVAAIITN